MGAPPPPLIVRLERIQVGATGMYEARCRHHFEPPREDEDPGA